MAESKKSMTPITTEIKSGILEYENTEGQIDPFKKVVVSNEYIEEFLDLVPLSESCQNLLERETLIFHLLRRGCTNFRWILIRKETGPIDG